MTDMLRENGKRKIAKRTKVLASVFIILGFLLCLYLLILGNIDNIIVTDKRVDKEIISVDNTTRKVIKDDSAPVGKVIEYSFKLDDPKEHEACLAFYTIHQFVTVYMDGEEIYKLEKSEKLDNVKTPGTNWTMIPLYHEDEGKEVVVKLAPAYKSFIDADIKFLIGPEVEIIVKSLRKSLPVLMISALAIIMGMMFLVLSIYLMWKDKKMNDIFPLGILAVLLGAWRFTDTGFSPFLSPDRPILMFYMSVMSLMAGIIPFAMSIKARTRLRLTENYCIIVGIINIIAIFADILGLINLREILGLMHALLFIGVFIILYNLFKGWRSKEAKPGDNIDRFAILILIVGIIGDAIVFYTTGTSAGLFFTVVTFLIAIIIEGVAYIYMYLRNEKLLIEQEKQLINNRATAMMGQIRSHFVFNILNAISGMCKYDPEKADETVVQFSRYLRANVDLMNNDEPTMFRVALERLRDYISLEQVRFGEKIRFVEDIKTEDFKLPALILQPIVENAIKHGILPKKDGGTITLKTFDEGENIIIEIIDDGVGYDTEVAAREGSAGMKNVRFRLDYFLKGKMEINSIVGQGTVVMIILPRKEAGI